MSDNSTILTPVTLSSLLGQDGIDVARTLYSHEDRNKQHHLLDTYAIYNLRHGLSSLLSFYQAELNATNPALFTFLDKQEKERLINQLTFTYYLLYAQCQLDITEKRSSELSRLNKAREHCDRLIKQLELDALELSPEAPALKETIDSDKHVKYCGLTIVASQAIESVKAFINSASHRVTGSIKDVMGEVNGFRLYWVWSGGLLSTVLSLIPNTFFNVTQAQKGVAAPSPITGCMSWMLYYARFGINLGLLLKHTIKGPWMSDAEASNIPTWERFKTQWQLRKFELLNDAIWATLNMSCFFWLTGSGLAGYAGNVLTAGLLLMDLSLSIWKYQEAHTRHNQQIEELNAANNTLQGKIQTERKFIEHNENYADEGLKIIRELEEKIKSNEALQKSLMSDWAHNRRKMINDMVYSGALLAGFGLMCCLFCPPALMAASTAMIFGLIGATFCFLLNIVSAGVSGGLDIHRTKQSQRQTKETIKSLLEDFTTSEGDAQKILYLEIRAHLATSIHQQKMIRIQAIKLVRTILVDAMIPVVIFTTLVFMPLGMGIGVLAAAFALGALSKMLIKRFEPKEAELPKFNETEFQIFCANPITAVSHYEKQTHCFLTHTAHKPEQIDEANSLVNDPFDEPPEESLLAH